MYSLYIFLSTLVACQYADITWQLMTLRHLPTVYRLIVTGRFSWVSDCPKLRRSPTFPSGRINQCQDSSSSWYQILVTNLPPIDNSCDCLWWWRPGPDLGKADLGISRNQNGLYQQIPQKMKVMLRLAQPVRTDHSSVKLNGIHCSLSELCTSCRYLCLPYLATPLSFNTSLNIRIN